MRIIRGLSDSPQRDTQLALEQTKRALESEPENALTLAVEGYAGYLQAAAPTTQPIQ